MQRADAVPLVDQGADDVRADEAGRAGDERFHAVASYHRDGPTKIGP